MSDEILNSLKEQAESLSPQEKFILANYLLEKAKNEEINSVSNTVTDEDIRRRQMEWLKAHRDEYAGQYVALDGDVLVGHGATIREAHEQAKQKGVSNPFLVRVFAEDTILSAGL